MLTYTFSRREKGLLAVLACVLVLVLWYQFVFVNVQNQTTALDGRINDAKDQLVVDQAKITQMSSMQKSIDGYKSQGLVPTNMPKYDNMQNLMTILNTTLSQTENYTLKFDDLDTKEAGVAKRGVSLTFGCASYDAAKATISSLQKGIYTCSVDSVSITDTAASKTTSTSNIGSGSTSTASKSAYAVVAHLTFYEKTS